MARASFCAVIGLGFALAGCGGEDRGRPSAEGSSSEPLDPCRAADGYEFQSIMDFEPADARIACDAGLGAMCEFYFNYDRLRSVFYNVAEQRVQVGDDCDVILREGLAESIPDVGSNFESDLIPGGRCDAPSSGFHITAVNIGMCVGEDGRIGWGASADVTVAYDASEWDGISFWIRRGEGVSGNAILFTVSDYYTSGGALDPETNLPLYCTTAETALDTEKCDAFGVAVTLTEEWTFVPALFSAMRQKGFGASSPNGVLDTTQIERLQFLMGPGDWDIWVDDVALFRRPE